MNLLIFLDLTYNPGKNFKFYSLPFLQDILYLNCSKRYIIV